MKWLPGLLPDSNFFILMFRLKRLPFEVLKRSFADYEIFTCQMVMLEVLCGIADTRVLVHTTQLFEGLHCVKMQDSRGDWHNNSLGSGKGQCGGWARRISSLRPVHLSRVQRCWRVTGVLRKSLS